MRLTTRNHRTAEATPRQRNGGESSSQKSSNHKNNYSHRDWKRRTNHTILRSVQLKWRLATISFKIKIAVMVLWIFFLVVLKIWDQCYTQVGVLVLDQHKTALSSPSTFSVVINTFRRPERLHQTVRHYAETCGKDYQVGRVFVVWADQDTEPPASGDFFLVHNNNLRTTTHNNNNNNNNNNNKRVSVKILKKNKDSLNARFEPIPNLSTTAVFMVDDDIRVDCPSLQRAFVAWQEHSNSMVGYYPRLAAHSKTANRQLVYHAWPMVYLRQELNIVLTKATFLHSKYLELYTNDKVFPKEIKDHVDTHRNCEDIAMSMLVANYTKYQNSSNKNGKNKPLPARPIYVEGTVSDVGLFGGISSGSGHFATRSECLTQLTEILQSKGWDPPLDDAFDLPTSSYIRHAFWWQANPSNIFEWLGLANVFS